MLFRDDYYFLSNMYPCDVTIKIDGSDYTFRCSESAYQAMKCPPRFREFLSLDGYRAKDLGKTVIKEPGFDSNKYDIMQHIVTQKFKQNENIRNRLLYHTPEIIVEDNDWNDTYWGVYKGVGQNKLGEILMDIRKRMYAGEL